MFRKGDIVYCLINGELKVMDTFSDCIVCVNNEGFQVWYNLEGILMDDKSTDTIGVSRCLFFTPPKFENWDEMVSTVEWKPSIKEYYWVVSGTGEVNSYKWYNVEVDIKYYEVGNCFKTEEEARCSKFYKVFNG